MKRVLAIWLPNWSVQRQLSGKPEVAPSPSPSPEYQGGGLKSHDPLADRAALVELAQWCHRFSPTVGLEESEAPETILLDATNLAPLYGGEQQLVAQVAQGLHRLRLDARIALADTIGAAWALSHHGFTNSTSGATAGLPSSGNRVHASALLDEPAVAPMLAPLPIAALRLPDDLLETLKNLGVERVGDLFDLPRDQLRSRFGPLLALRLDQALGTAREVFAAVEPPVDFTVEQAFEFPVANHEAVHYTVEKLLGRLAWLLAAHCAGALRVACRFDCEGAPSVSLEVGLFQPTAHPRRLFDVVELQMERLRLPAPATGVSIQAIKHAPLVPRQSVLFDEDRSLEGSLPLAALVDRLASRLGREAVVRYRLQSEAQPELAYRAEPLMDSKPRPLKRIAAKRRPASAVGATGRVRLAPLDRPLCVLNRPAPLETLSVVPDGPPISFRRNGRAHHIARQWGPERIETGWWRGQSAGRDYYRVETTEGRRFWLFRRRRDGGWFLHGIYE